MSKTTKALELAAAIATGHFGQSVTVADILSRKRIRPFLIARQVATYFLRTHYSQTVTEIGRFMGKDHTTVIHSVVIVRDMLQTGMYDYTEIYERLVQVMDEQEQAIPNEYIVRFPKYADHNKLKEDLIRLFNIQIIPNERTIYDPTAAQQVFSDARGDGAPVQHGALYDAGLERQTESILPAEPLPRPVY